MDAPHNTRCILSLVLQLTGCTVLQSQGRLLFHYSKRFLPTVILKYYYMIKFFYLQEFFSQIATNFSKGQSFLYNIFLYCSNCFPFPSAVPKHKENHTYNPVNHHCNPNSEYSYSKIFS